MLYDAGDGEPADGRKRWREGIMHFRVTEYTIQTDPVNSPKEPFAVMVLSDLHNEAYGRNNEQLLNQIRKEAPAFLVSTGDLVTAKAGKCAFDQAAVLVRKLSAEFPIYLIQGNHELRMQNTEAYGSAYASYIKKAGIAFGDFRDIHTAGSAKRGAWLLNDAAAAFNVMGMNVALFGYTVPLQDYHRTGRCSIREEHLRLAFSGLPASPETYKILAAHHPDGFPAYAKWGADLSLTGHVHGGIVRVPLLGGVVGASLRPFPPYTRGSYTLDGHRMILSGGLGSHTIKLRINNPPELVCLRFMPSEEKEGLHDRSVL